MYMYKVTVHVCVCWCRNESVRNCFNVWSIFEVFPPIGDTYKRPFQVQNVKNSGIMLLCEECGIWRLVYATRKLKKNEVNQLNATLEGLSFSCGSPLQDLKLDCNILSEVYVQDLQCMDPVEPLYYAAELQEICAYCCEELQNTSTRKEYYPQCEGCQEKEKIPRNKQNNG